RPWSMYVEPHGLDEPPPRWLRRWKGDGILARITDREMAKLIRATGLPAIDLRGAVPDSGIPLVGLDSPAAVEMAFAHLRDRGFRQFACCGVQPGQYRFLDLRAEAFERQVRDAGFAFDKFPAEGANPARTWDEEQRQIARWVSRLPKPVGILACHDDRG